MYTLSHKNKKNKIIVVSKIAGPTKIDAGELNLLARFGDRRIVTPAEIGRKKLVYELTGVVPLSRFFATYVTEETFFRIITDFVQVMATLERANLPLNNLIIKGSYIFVSPAGQEIRFLYQPLYNSEARFDVLFFLQNLLNRRIAPTGSVTPRLNSFRQFLYSQPYFSTAAFLDFLTPRQQTPVRRMPKPAPTPRPRREVNDYRPPVRPVNYNLTQFDDSATVSINDLANGEIGTSVLGGTNTLGTGAARKGMLVRKKTKETIAVNKSVFKIGADKAHVDCWVSRNRAVSRVHAILTNYNNKYYLKDNNSTNFTYLNGKRLSPGEEYELKTGDEITIANEVYLFREQ